MRLLLLLVLIGLTPFAASATPAGPFDFAKPTTATLLEPEVAFPVSALFERGQVVVRWHIAPGYYLYRKQFQFSSNDPVIEFDAPQFPSGDWVEDEFFGKSEVFRGLLTVTLPLRGAVTDGSLTVRFQGCADIGVCYLPQTVTLPLFVTR